MTTSSERRPAAITAETPLPSTTNGPHGLADHPNATALLLTPFVAAVAYRLYGVQNDTATASDCPFCGGAHRHLGRLRLGPYGWTIGRRRAGCGLGHYLVKVTAINPPAPLTQAPPEPPPVTAWEPDVRPFVDPADAPAVAESWLDGAQ